MMAEINTTSSNTDGASVGNLDELTNILAEAMGVQDEPASPKKEKDDEDSLEDDAAGGEDKEKVADADGEGVSTEEDAEGETESDSEDTEPPTWAAVLGLDEKQIVLDDEGNFTGVITKVDGVTEQVKLHDLVAGYQTAKSNTQKAQNLAEEKRQFETVKQTVFDTYINKLDDIEKINTYFHKQLIKDYQGLDWESIRNANPGEYAALVQEFQIKNAEFEKIKNAVVKEKQSEQSKLAEESQKLYKEFTQANIDKVLEKNPTWTDKAKLKAAFEEMSDMLQTKYGFSQQDFNVIQDARIIEVLKDLTAFHKSMQEGAKKIVTHAPKFQKNVSSSSTTKKATKLELLTKKAKSSSGYQKSKLETDAVAELLSGI